jgi:hypothetical protein
MRLTKQISSLRPASCTPPTNQVGLGASSGHEPQPGGAEGDTGTVAEGGGGSGAGTAAEGAGGSPSDLCVTPAQLAAAVAFSAIRQVLQQQAPAVVTDNVIITIAHFSISISRCCVLLGVPCLPCTGAGPGRGSPHPCFGEVPGVME